ncbi:MAG: T9SS type A sorting domain-containing protein [Ferruginibacter sp.]
MYVTFQIILTPKSNANGYINLQYNDAETTSPVPSSLLNFGTIGIEDATGANGILYRFNGNYGSMFGSPLSVLFRPPVAQPVTLLNFSALRNYGSNKLSWTTSQETNSSYFAVERSNDGRNFKSIGQVTAAGNSNDERTYSFIDNTPSKGINYYRLKMVDIDNNIKYSFIKNVRNEGLADINVYPNPVKDVLKVTITADRKTPGNISITDNSGRLLYNKATLINEGLNTIDINAAKFSAGSYLIKVQVADDVVIKKLNKF